MCSNVEEAYCSKQYKYNKEDISADQWPGLKTPDLIGCTSRVT